MATVLIVPHHLRPEAAQLASDAIDWLTERGHDVRVPREDAEQAGLEEWATSEDAAVEGADLALAIGGDGTMLHTVDLVCGSGIPVLGINVGQLGYLTEVEPAGWRAALEAYFDGRYAVQSRMTLEVALQPADGSPTTRVAMNEAVLEKTLSGHTVRLALTVNDGPFLTIAADGLIVATPTGSTAYNLSARGPIASPRLRALIVTPVSPHTLFDRSLVLDDTETVCIEVLDGRPAALVVDGRSLGTLAPGDSVRFRAGPHDAHLVSFGGRDFHQILKAKFALADR
jgi:NAD+ kinase